MTNNKALIERARDPESRKNGRICALCEELINALESAQADRDAICAEATATASAQIAEALTMLDGEPEYHAMGMGCGLEDRNITDRYEAMRFGWEEAMGRIFMEHINPAIEALTQHPTSDYQAKRDDEVERRTLDWVEKILQFQANSGLTALDCLAAIRASKEGE